MSVDLRSGPHCIENLEYEHVRGRKGPPRRVFWNVIALSTLSLSFLSSFSLSSHFLASRKQNFCTRKCRRRQNITPRSAASSPIFPFERKSLFAFCNLPLSFPFGPHMPSLPSFDTYVSILSTSFSSQWQGRVLLIPTS